MFPVRPFATYNQLFDRYGNPLHDTHEWIPSHITETEHPYFDKVIRIQHNKDITENLHYVFARLQKADEARKGRSILTFDGCFNPRCIRGSDAISLHAFGLALDFNASENPMGSHVPHQASPLVELMQEAGFFWGARFHHRPDPMHWEYTTGGI